MLYILMINEHSIADLFFTEQNSVNDIWSILMQDTLGRPPAKEISLVEHCEYK